MIQFLKNDNLLFSFGMYFSNMKKLVHESSRDTTPLGGLKGESIPSASG